MTIRSDRIVGGVAYGLSHLNPFTIRVAPKGEGAPIFKVLVSFGSHTFSREWQAGDRPDFAVTDDTGTRCFCPIRHGHSLNLPRIVAAAVQGKAYFSQRQNFLLVEALPGLNGPYAIFFNVQKAKSKEFDVAMFVVSAYEKPNLPRKLPTITFATLIAKTSRGEPVYRPKK